MRTLPTIVTVSMTLPAELVAELDRIAEVEDRSRSSVARRLLAAAVAKMDPKETT